MHGLPLFIVLARLIGVLIIIVIGFYNANLFPIEANCMLYSICSVQFSTVCT